MTALTYAFTFFWLLFGCRRPADERWGYFAFALAILGSPTSDLPSAPAASIGLAASVASTYALYLALRVRELRTRGVA